MKKRLDVLLVERGLAESRAQAQALVLAGLVPGFGKPGTQVVLTVVRKDVDAPLVFSLTREEINFKSVRAKLVEPGYGFVRVTQFQERTGEDLANTIARQALLTVLEAIGPNAYSAELDRDLLALQKNDPAVAVREGAKQAREKMDKLLAVWPLIREIQKIEDQLQGLSDSPERRSCLEQYLTLHDRLADAMAKETIPTTLVQSE